MVSISKILVPVDFSDWSRSALAQAIDLGSHFGAVVEVLHVYEVPPIYVPNVMAQVDGEPPPTVYQSIRREAKRELTAFLLQALPAATRNTVKTRRKVLCGEPAGEIVRWATSGRHDLIVMGTRGRSGFSRMLLGSVAESVLRRAPCPVLTIRRGATEGQTNPATAA